MAVNTSAKKSLTTPTWNDYVEAYAAGQKANGVKLYKGVDSGSTCIIV